MQGAAPGSLGKLVFPMCQDRLHLDEVVRVGWQLRGRSPSACAMLAFNATVRTSSGCDVKDLIKLPQRFGKATEPHIGKGVLGEEISVAHIETLSLVEVFLALLPLAASSCDVRQRLCDAAVIGEELTCLLKIMDCCVVILQACVVVIALSENASPRLG